MTFRLCVPTLNRYDLLRGLLESAKAGSVPPTGYYIVDNGGRLPVEEWGDVLGAVRGVHAVHAGRYAGSTCTTTAHATILTPPRNLGVASSWNAFLALFEPIIIANDDLVLRPEALQTLTVAMATSPVVLGYGFALFAHRPDVTARVGYFDESFYPAYYEDCDYELRLRRAGITYQQFEPGALAEHTGWSTSHATEDRVILDAPERNRRHFIAKWGAVTGHCSGGGPDPQLFAEPFNGTPPPGWRRAQRCPFLPMRWDILNAIAARIGAERYLEIGVADGDNIRRIDVAERHGVDPVPSPGGQRACTTYFPYSSGYFFAERGKSLPSVEYDLIFIDGDHRAERVLEEVEHALACLSPRGVIVLHDCNPATEAMQTETYTGGLWSGTVWRAVVKLRAMRTELSIRVVDADYGVGIIVPGSSEYLEFAWDGPEPTPWEIPYAELERRRAALLGLLPPNDWEGWFDTAVRRRTAPVEPEKLSAE